MSVRNIVLQAPKNVFARTVARPATVAGIQTRFKSSQPNYPGHVPLNWFEHAFMFAGASYMSFMHPARGGTDFVHVHN
jgi:ubiquinone biosynthesis protein COQ4